MWRAVFRPIPAGLERPARYLALVAGLMAAWLATSQSSMVGALALVLVVVVAAVPSFTGRRLWPWQALFISSGLLGRSEMKRITGAANWTAAAAWLAIWPDAPVIDRYHVLGFIGHEEEAEWLIEDFLTRPRMTATSAPGPRLGAIGESADGSTSSR